MYKAGDEVLIRAEVTDISPSSERPYFVAPDCRSINWVSEDKIIPMDKTYADGLADAWELANKMARMEFSDLKKIFGHDYFPSLLVNYTYKEALSKIEAYEKEKEIKVGDVVEDEEGTKALVIDEGLENTCFVFTENGCVEDWYKVDLKNTGKKILIGDLLRQIGE